MEVTIIHVESEAERRKRLLNVVDNIFQERAESEARRRQVWVLEEEERRRRIRGTSLPLHAL